MRAKMNFIRQSFQKLSSDRQTDRQTKIITTAASRVVITLMTIKTTSYIYKYQYIIKQKYTHITK